MRKPGSRRKAQKMGARFTVTGFYVEGRWFGRTDAAMQQASAFAASLAAEYGRAVAIDACHVPGHGAPAFKYFPEDSFEVETRTARRDAFGYVLVCS